MISVNLWAVVLAMLSSMAIGAIWYAQGAFGRIWAKLAHVDVKNKKPAEAVKPLVITVIVSFITAYVLAHMTFLAYQFFAYTFFQDAIITAFWLWLGFTAARFATHDAFEGRPLKLTLLNIAHELVTVMVMALIIGAFGAPMG